MKWMILLSMVSVAAMAGYALAHPAADTPKPVAAPGPAGPTGPTGHGMACCAGGMMAGKAANRPVLAVWFTCPMHTDVRMTAAGKCPKCGMTLVKVPAAPAAGPKGMMARRMGMMSKAGMTPEAMKRMRVMMRTPISMDGPAAIYSQAADLGLSGEQKAKLLGIENEARTKALAVLTPEQRKKMGKIPDKPMAMMQMCQRMGPMMKSMPGMKGGKGGPMMMCPMMKKMGGAAGEAGEAAEKPAAKPLK